jgi:hypothetical protein
MATQHRRRNAVRRRASRYRHRWRNHSRRRADRIERLVVGCLLALFVTCVPVAALAAQAIYKHTAAVSEQMRAAGHWATAVVLHDVPAGTAQVQARWRQTGGPSHVGMIRAAAGEHAGSELPLWLNASGTPTTPPPATVGIAIFAISTGIAIVILVACVVELARRGTRRLAERARLTGWETEWRSVEPQWTRSAG